MQRIDELREKVKVAQAELQAAVDEHYLPQYKEFFTKIFKGLEFDHVDFMMDNLTRVRVTSIECPVQCELCVTIEMLFKDSTKMEIATRGDPGPDMGSDLNMAFQIWSSNTWRSLYCTIFVPWEDEDADKDFVQENLENLAEFERVTNFEDKRIYEFVKSMITSSKFQKYFSFIDLLPFDDPRWENWDKEKFFDFDWYLR